MASGAGAQETQRTLKEALVGGLWNSTAQVQRPGSPLYSWCNIEQVNPLLGTSGSAPAK